MSVAAIHLIAMEMILASASPRRREILAHLLPAFSVCPATCSEAADFSQPPDRIVEQLARQKAENVFLQHPAAIVLGADTIVWAEGKVLGKPKDAADAVRMLRSLSGKAHCVYTGYCLLGPSVDIGGSAVTEVCFHDLTDEWIAEYVATGSPLDKAGAYGIQDDARLVRSIRGSYTNVVGLPEEEIAARLTEIGVLP